MRASATEPSLEKKDNHRRLFPISWMFLKRQREESMDGGREGSKREPSVSGRKPTVTG